MALLFDVNRPAMVKHIQNIYSSGKVEQDSTYSILERVVADGKKRKMKLYNLDVIISVGYRVNSSHATKFWQWLLNGSNTISYMGILLMKNALPKNSSR
jgi:hypothetical protein